METKEWQQEWILNELASLERLEREAPWVQEELNYLDTEQYVEAFEMLHKEKGLFVLPNYTALARKWTLCAGKMKATLILLRRRRSSESHYQGDSGLRKRSDGYSRLSRQGC